MKNKIHTYIFLFTVLSFVFGCKSKLKPLEFVRWIENSNNKLRIEQVEDKYYFQLQYKPLEYVVLLEYPDKNMSKENFEKYKKEFEGTQYFTLRIGNKDRQRDLISFFKNEDKVKKLEYLNFKFQDDIKLLDGADTLQCVLYHMEYTNGIMPQNNFLLGFNKTNDKNDKTLLINGKIFELKKISLTIKSKDIKKIPKLIVK